MANTEWTADQLIALSEQILDNDAKQRELMGDEYEDRDVYGAVVGVSVKHSGILAMACALGLLMEYRAAYKARDWFYSDTGWLRSASPNWHVLSVAAEKRYVEAEGKIRGKTPA